jgi:hypothetical protein
MKAVLSSETLLTAYQTVLCHNLEIGTHIFTDMKNSDLMQPQSLFTSANVWHSPHQFLHI